MPDLRHPAINPRYRVTLVEPTTVFLLDEKEHIALDGELYRALIPLLDGVRSRADICAALRGRFSTLEVALGLSKLAAGGFICESDDVSTPGAAFWTTCDVSAAGLKEDLARLAVCVVSLGSADPTAFVRALESLNVKISSESEGEGVIAVVVTDDYLSSELGEWNLGRLRQRLPWMLTRLVGATTWLGPVFVPGETGCWQCLAHRLTGNRPVQTFLKTISASNGSGRVGEPSLEASVQIAANMAALMLVQWMLNPGSSGAGVLTTVDMQTISTTRHQLKQRPQCGACGEATNGHQPSPIHFESRLKLSIGDGGHRSTTPDQTVSRYLHHVSPITGIVSKLEPYVTDSDVLNVHYANHPMFTPGGDLLSLRKSLQNTTAGKGRTPIQSKASALCEALERYSGIFSGDESRTRATFREMDERAVHPSSCLLFSERQYAKRQEWNPAHSSFAWIPDPFDEERAIDWTPVWSLKSRSFRFFPTALCYYDYRLEAGHQFCSADSNGSASGNNLEEAVLQGFMELVERDAIALWWYNRLSRPGVDLDSFDDHFVRAVQAEYERRNREMWVLDVTSDLGIPTFAAVSRRLDSHEEIIQGYGSHFDPDIAMSRAITEMNQMLVHLMHATDVPMEDPDLEDWYRSATVDTERYLLPDKRSAPRRRSDYTSSTSTNLRDDVVRCVELADRAGMETFVLDQTRPDVGLSVVKVIVPGMRHFWARFAPGRLFDVPVRLGWMPQPCTEDQLNPLPICS